MNLTKWMPLWEKCPELRPDGLKWGHGNDTGWFLTEPMVDRGQERQVSREFVAASLIRDRAVWWLADKGWRLVRGEKWFFGMNSGISSIGSDVRHHWKITESSTDTTEACYLACCNVLGVEA